MLREVRLTLDLVLECSDTIVLLIDPDLNSCGTVRPHGAAGCAHTEPGFYIAGDEELRAGRHLLAGGGEWCLAAMLTRLGQVSITAVLAMLVLHFGFRGEQILTQPLVILLLVVRILLQVDLNAGLAYWLNKRLVVAMAIALFGLNPRATVVGVLIEVPVMLSVVRIVLATRRWYEGT